MIILVCTYRNRNGYECNTQHQLYCVVVIFFIVDYFTQHFSSFISSDARSAARSILCVFFLERQTTVEKQKKCLRFDSRHFVISFFHPFIRSFFFYLQSIFLQKALLQSRLPTSRLPKKLYSLRNNTQFKIHMVDGNPSC